MTWALLLTTFKLDEIMSTVDVRTKIYEKLLFIPNKNRRMKKHLGADEISIENMNMDIWAMMHKA